MAKDISLSFDEIYLNMASGEVRGVSCSGPSMTFEQSYPKFDEFEFPIVFYQNIKNHGKQTRSQDKVIRIHI